MNAPSQTATPAPLSLVHYLTSTALPENAACDFDQIDALGALGTERRRHALDVLASGFQKRFTVEMRLRIVMLMRELREKGRHGGARFILDLFGKLENNASLVARELALQVGAEGQPLRALELWTTNLVVHNDPLGITHVAYMMPALAKLEEGAPHPALVAFVDKLARAAPIITSSEAAFKDIEPRLDRLNKALSAHGFAAEARAVGKIAIDLKLKWGLTL